MTIGLMLTCAGWAAHALDDVTVRVSGGNEELQGLLERASVTRQLLNNTEEGVAIPSGEAVSTARTEYRQMVGALYSEGYYGGTVSVQIDGREAADLSLVAPPANVSRVVITVDPGPQFRFSRADVSPIAPETELPDGYAAGEIARSGEIRRAAQTGVAAWRQAGHAKVALTDETIVADHAQSVLSSELRIEPGPQLRFGPLIVMGNNRVRTERIIAIAGLPEGEVYDPEELDDAADRLRRAGAFRAVTLTDAETIGPDNTLPIELVVAEEKRRRLGGGAEISSTEGIGLRAYWMHRNLLSGAENLRFDFEIDGIGSTADENGINYSLTGTFRRPATPITDMDLLTFGGLIREDEPGYVSESAFLGTGFSYYLSDDLEFGAALAYRGSRIEDAFGEREFQMFTFPSYIVYDTRDVELDPTRGFFLRADVEPFVGVDGIENGAYILADGRAYLGFGEERNIVAAGRVQLGSLVGPEIPDAPPDFLFFAGGGGSVRGQPYESLGAGEVDGTIIGGRSYIGLSAELRAYVRGPFGVVGFFDAGYIGAEEFYDGSGNWMTGAGLGARYDTGFGPIRVDIAVPVDGGPDDADAVQIYIGIGQAF